MKRLLSAALALSLLGGSAAVAAPYNHGGQGHNTGYSNQGYSDSYGNQDRGSYYRQTGNNDWQRRHRHHHSWYQHDGSRFGYDNGNHRGSGNNYGDHRGGYGDNERHR